MVMGLTDQFRFGMYRTHKVQAVLRHKPSYIAWITMNTSTKFEQAVYDELNSIERRCPLLFRRSRDLMRRYHNRMDVGPW